MSPVEKKRHLAFMRRTLARLAERGLDARTLMLLELAREAVDAEYSDRFFGQSYGADYGEPTYRDVAEGFVEILGERDFTAGLQDDYNVFLGQYGVPRPTREERLRVQVYACLVGRTSNQFEHEGR